MRNPLWRPMGMPRRHQPLVAMAGAVLDTIGALTRGGCRVLDAHVLPQASVRVDRCPDGLDTWAYKSAPPGAIPGPLEHYAVIGGVLVRWDAIPNRSNSYV